MTTVDPDTPEENTSEKTEHSATSVLRTLVLCDLVDSTALVERLGDQRAAELFRKHDRLARTLVQQHGGKEIDKTDGFLLMFERPIQAVAFALAYQRDIAAMNGRETTKLATRFGIHVGDVVVWDNAADDIKRGAKPTEVEGLVKPVAARLMQLALPGQILLSGTAYDIAHRAQGELGAQLANVCWRTHGRYRFKGVPDLVPVFEVGETGIAPLKPPPWSGKASRETPIWRRPLGIGFELGVLALLIAAPIFYLTRPTPAIAFANRDWVVVGDLKNLTGEKAFDDSLQTAFRIGLEQSRYVNVVPELQVRDALKRMERDPSTTKVDRGIGSEIAERQGARALILPTIAEFGGHIRITAEVVDPRTQTSVYSDSVDGAGEDSVLPAMDDLLKKMRGQLGESLASIGETSAPLAEATTKNLDALKAFGKAEAALASGKVSDALLLLKEALRIDPSFAMAWARQATIQLAFLNDSNAAYASLQNAREHRDRLTAREQLAVEGTLARFDDASKWMEVWKTYAAIYPDYPAAQQNLGMGLMWYEHQLAEAKPHFSAVANSRHIYRGASWYSLAMIDTELGDDRAAMASIAKGRALNMLVPHFEDVLPDLAQRRYDAVEARLQAMSDTLPPAILAEKQLKLAAVAVDQGKNDEARKYLNAAKEIAGRAPAEAQLARIQLARAALDLATHEPGAKSELAQLISGESRRAAGAGAAVDGSVAIHLALAAMLAVRADEPKLARDALEATRKQALDHGYYDRASLWRTADCEARFAKDAQKRIACLTPFVDGREFYQTHVALMLAYQAAGEVGNVRTQALWLLQHRGQAIAELENEPALIMNMFVANSVQALLDATGTSTATPLPTASKPPN
ncbi:MAG: putative peptide modification system cyclase [Dokdonella sp.]